MLAGALLALWTSSTRADDDRNEPIIPNLPPTPTLTVSTVPPNGDLNPYGVAFVPHDFVAGGPLRRGDIIVSNFNNSANLQGTGTTIVRATSEGEVSVFFAGQPGLGLTTALGVLKRGFVLVGNVPTKDGSCATIQQGSLLIIDREGHKVANLSNAALLDGPWDLTLHDEGEHAQVFISNVLSGAVTRLELKIPEHGNDIIIPSARQIASGYAHRCDPSALVVGPTGLAYDAVKDTLYVASTDDNAVFAIPKASKRKSDAGKGRLVYTDNVHLHGPLALVLAPNGDLLTSNGDAVNPDPNQPSEIVEFTPAGHFVAQFSVNSSGIGGAFGIAITSGERAISFSAVDDILNSLKVWMIR
jgi:hypothetical protein